MVQGTPTIFYAARSQERPPGGRSGAARRASRLIPGEEGTFAGLVPARRIPPYRRDVGIPAGFGWADLRSGKGAALEVSWGRRA